MAKRKQVVAIDQSKDGAVHSNHEIRRRAMLLGNTTENEDVTTRAQDLIDAIGLTSTRPIDTTVSTITETGKKTNKKKILANITKVAIVLLVIAATLVGLFVTKACHSNIKVDTPPGTEIVKDKDNVDMPGTTDPRDGQEPTDEENKNNDSDLVNPSADEIANPEYIALPTKTGGEIIYDKNSGTIVSVNGFGVLGDKVQVSDTMTGVVGDEEEIAQAVAVAQKELDDLNSGKGNASDIHFTSDGVDYTASFGERGMN